MQKMILGFLGMRKTCSLGHIDILNFWRKHGFSNFDRILQCWPILWTIPSIFSPIPTCNIWIVRSIFPGKLMSRGVFCLGCSRHARGRRFCGVAKRISWYYVVACTTLISQVYAFLPQTVAPKIACESTPFPMPFQSPNSSDSNVRPEMLQVPNVDSTRYSLASAFDSRACGLSMGILAIFL